MRTCARCQREYPEVAGVDAQRCPHCAHEEPTRAPGPTSAAAPMGAAPGTPPADAAGGLSFAMRLARERYPRLLLLWLPAFAVEAIGGALLLAYQLSLGLPTTAEELQGAEPDKLMRFAGVAFPLFALTIVARVLAATAVAAEALDALRVDGGGHLARLRRRMPSALGFALGVTLLALAIPTVAALPFVVVFGGIGIVLMIIPLVVVFHLFLFAPAAQAHAAGGMAASIRESRRFARERRTFGFTLFVLLALVGASIVTAIVAYLASLGAEAAGAPPLWADLAASSLLNWLLLPVVAAMPAGFYALARQAPAERPVDASAPAAERFRTTKCPGCGTLVPYTATGQPVDVTCPVCGRTGKIL